MKKFKSLILKKLIQKCLKNLRKKKSEKLRKKKKKVKIKSKSSWKVSNIRRIWNADSWRLKNGSNSPSKINERFITWKNWDDWKLKNQKIRNKVNSIGWKYFKFIRIWKKFQWKKWKNKSWLITKRYWWYK
jgi:hypothetical protein